jgi:hypothetical protein
METQALKLRNAHIALSGLVINHYKPKALPWAFTFCPLRGIETEFAKLVLDRHLLK